MQTVASILRGAGADAGFVQDQMAQMAEAAGAPRFLAPRRPSGNTGRGREEEMDAGASDDDVAFKAYDARLVDTVEELVQSRIAAEASRNPQHAAKPQHEGRAPGSRLFCARDARRARSAMLARHAEGLDAEHRGAKASLAAAEEGGEGVGGGEEEDADDERAELAARLEKQIERSARKNAALMEVTEVLREKDDIRREARKLSQTRKAIGRCRRGGGEHSRGVPTGARHRTGRARSGRRRAERGAAGGGTRRRRGAGGEDSKVGVLRPRRVRHPPPETLRRNPVIDRRLR